MRNVLILIALLMLISGASAKLPVAGDYVAVRAVDGWSYYGKVVGIEDGFLDIDVETWREVGSSWRNYAAPKNMQISVAAITYMETIPPSLRSSYRAYD